MAENQVHQKTYPIEIYHTTDDVSSVVNLYIYGQFTPTLDSNDPRYISPDFNKSELIGVLYSVSNLPCKALESVYTSEVSIEVRYHDNDPSTMPQKPTGNGDTNGWHTNSTPSANWISQSLKDNYGKFEWSDPIDVSAYSLPNGQSGESRQIIWKGILSQAPSGPYFNWVYKSSNDNIIYEYDETYNNWIPFMLTGRDDGYGTGSWYNPTNPEELLLRDKYGYPEGDPNYLGTPSHGPYNKYIFNFDSYISGNYYYFWVRAEDSNGNLELLNNSSETNSQYIPLFTTSVKLVDTYAPEFNSTEKLDDASLSSGYYYIDPPSSVTDQTSLDEWIGSRRILNFDDSGINKIRYIVEYYWDNSSSKIKILLNYQSDLSSTLSNVYITDISHANAGIGQIALSIPSSNSINLGGYLVYRRNETSLTSSYDGTDTYEKLVGFVNQSKFTDVGLLFDHASMQDPNNQKFLYKIIPISKFTTDGEAYKQDFSNAIKGLPSFNAVTGISANIKTIDNYELYYPSLGTKPNNIVLKNPTTGDTSAWYDNSNNNGTIQLRWCMTSTPASDGDQTFNSIDVNGDIKGFIIERARETSTDESNWELGAWERISEAEHSTYPSYDDSVNNRTFEFSYLDAGLDDYNVNNIYDTSDPNYLLVRYAYRIKVIDYGGNSSDWSYFNYNTTLKGIPASDSVGPDISNYDLKVEGKIGSWYVEFVDSSKDTIKIELSRQRVDTDGTTPIAVDGELIHTFQLIDVGSDGVAVFTDSKPPSHTSWYGRFRVRGMDKNGNWSIIYPQSGGSDSWTTAVKSLTVDSAADKWPPKNPTNVNAQYSSTNNQTTINWDNPTEERVLDETTIDSVDGTGLIITVNSANWGSDEFINKDVRILSGGASGSTGKITTNSNTTITVDSWSSGSPSANDTFEIYDSLTDLDGTNILKNSQSQTIVVSDTTIDGVSGYTITSNTASWTTNEFVGKYLKIHTGTGAGNLSVINSNTATTITVDSWSAETPQIGDIFNVVDLVNTSWSFVSNINSSTVTTYTDRNPISGIWVYGVSSYDLSGNESDVIESNKIYILDIVPPEEPVIQSLYNAGPGLLVITFQTPINEIPDYYKVYIKDINGNSIFNSDGFYLQDESSRTTTENYKKVYGNTLSIYNVLDTSQNIGRYRVKIEAVDSSGNVSNSTYHEICNVFDANGNSIKDPFSYDGTVYTWDYNTSAYVVITPIVSTHFCKAYLDNWVPATDSEFDIPLPAADTSVGEYQTTDYRGNITIKIGTGSNKFDDRVTRVIIYRRSRPIGTSTTWSEFGYLSTVTVSKITDISEIATGITYFDTNLGNYIYEYRIHQVSGSYRLDITGVSLGEINSIDWYGFDLHTSHDDFNYDSFHNNVSKVWIPGKLTIKFPDVIYNDDGSYYEIFRSPYQYYDSTSGSEIHWSTDNFYGSRDSTTHLLPINTNSSGDQSWERVAIIPSTPNMNTTNNETNIIVFEDNDWSQDGDIEDPNLTVFSALEYQNRARYAIVAVDKWGNRGKPYFVGGVEQTTYAYDADHANSWLYLPGIDRVYYVEINSPEYQVKFDDENNLITQPFDLTAVITYKYPDKSLTSPYFIWKYEDDYSGNIIEISGNNTNTLTVDVNAFSNINVRTYYVYVYKDQSSYNSGDGSLTSDTQGIVKLKDGETTLYALLTNESHLVPCDENGQNPDLSGATTTMTVYKGFNDISSQFSFSIVHDGSANTIVTQSGSYNNTITVTALDDNDSVLNIDITATNNSDSSITVTKRFVVTKAFKGSKGTDSKYVVTTLDNYAFKVDKETYPFEKLPDKITAKVLYYNFTLDATTPYTWKYSYSYYNSTSGQWEWSSWLDTPNDGTTDTYVIDKNDSMFNGGNVIRIKCIVKDDLGNTYEDPQSIYTVTDGVGWIWGLTNDNITVPALYDGTVPDFTDIYTDTFVILVDHYMTYENADPPSDGNYTITSIDEVNCTATVDTSTGRVSVTSFDQNAQTGYVDIHIKATSGDNTLTGTSRLTLTKSKEAIDAHYVRTFTTSQVITYNKKGNYGTPSPSSVTLSVSTYGFSPISYQWAYSIDNGSSYTDIVGATEDTFILNHNDSYWSGKNVITLKCKVNGEFGELADPLSIYKSYDGSGYTYILTNESHAVAADWQGNIIDLSTATTDLLCYFNGTTLTYVSKNPGDVLDDEFTASITSTQGCTATLSSTGTLTIDSMTSDNAYAEVTFYVDHGDITAIRKMTLHKNRSGDPPFEASLTNYFFGIPYDSNGERVDTDPVETYMNVYKDGVDVTSDFTISETHLNTNNDSVIAVSGNRVYLTDHLYTSSETITITATYNTDNTIEYSQVWKVSKINDGAVGEDGIIASLDIYSTLLQANPDGSLKTSLPVSTYAHVNKGTTEITNDFTITVDSITNSPSGTTGTSVSDNQVSVTSMTDDVETADITIKLDSVALAQTFYIHWIVSKIKEGETAVNVTLSNASHVVKCKSNGNPIVGELGPDGKAQTEIKATLGGVGMTAVTTAPTYGEYRVIDPPTLSSGIDPTSDFKAGTDNTIYYINGMTEESGTVTFTIEAGTYTGVVTITKVMSLVKQLDGKNITYADTAPSNPKDEDLWYDTTNKELKKYDEATTQWQIISDETSSHTAWDIRQLPDNLPSGGGFALTNNHLGFYNSGKWQVYMESYDNNGTLEGHFYVGNNLTGSSEKYLLWDGTSLILKNSDINLDPTFVSSSSQYWSDNSSRLTNLYPSSNGYQNPYDDQSFWTLTNDSYFSSSENALRVVHSTGDSYATSNAISINSNIVEFSIRYKSVSDMNGVVEILKGSDDSVMHSINLDRSTNGYETLNFQKDCGSETSIKIRFAAYFDIAISEGADFYVNGVDVNEWDPFVELSDKGFYAFNNPASYVKIGTNIFEFKGVDLEAEDLIVKGDLTVLGTTFYTSSDISGTKSSTFTIDTDWNSSDNLFLDFGNTQQYLKFDTSSNKFSFSNILRAPNIGEGISEQITITSDGQQSITLTYSPISIEYVHLYKNGLVLRRNSDYTLSGNTITLTGGTDNFILDDDIYVEYYY